MAARKPSSNGNSKTAQGYIAGIGASGALLAGAVVTFVFLVGAVSFEVWPTAAGQSGDDALGVAELSGPGSGTSATSLGEAVSLLAAAVPNDVAEPKSTGGLKGGAGGFEPGSGTGTDQGTSGGSTGGADGSGTAGTPPDGGSTQPSDDGGSGGPSNGPGGRNNGPGRGNGGSSGSSGTGISGSTGMPSTGWSGSSGSGGSNHSSR